MAIAPVVNRRDFLKTGAAGGVALGISFHLSPRPFGDQAPERFLSYGELVEGGAKLAIPNLNTVPLKNSDDFTVVGHDTRRFEGRDKATGAAKFGIDSRVPGMLFAVVARCPVFGGKVASFDAAKTKAVPGVRDVIQFETSGRGASTTAGIAVLADNSLAAIQRRNALDVKWADPLEA